MHYLSKIKLKTLLSFLIAWLLFVYYSGTANNFNKPPMSVHQGAQCDRASLSQNYYYNNFRILYPEVNENRCNDGIVSCEFPIISYTAALAYKTLGYNETYFRTISFLIYTLGILGLFLLFKRNTNTIIALLLVFLISSSPILLFYSNNFIPDIASFGLILFSWYLYFKLFIPHPHFPKPQKNTLHTLLFFLTLTLSIAIKTTAIIHYASMFGLLILTYLKPLKIEIYNKKQLLIALISALLLPSAWFLWSKHLAQHHNSAYFLMQIPKFESFQHFQSAWQTYYNNWPNQAYASPIFGSLIAISLINLFWFKRESIHLWILSQLTFWLSVLFFIIMLYQFRYHDYYIICLLPALFLNLIYFIQSIKKLHPWWIKALGILAILLATNYQYNQGKSNLHQRYEKGNYWEQSHHQSEDYITFKKLIQPYNINRENCTLVGYDNNPNTILYLLHLRGFRLNADQPNDYLKEILTKNKPQYIISNNPEFEQRVKSIVNIDLLKEYKNLKLFKPTY